MIALALGVGALAGIGIEAPAYADDKVRVTQFQDIAFGLVAVGSGDIVSSQNLCAYTSSASNAYSVRATGSGSGSALSLQSPAGSLPFEVQWADNPNQTSGRLLRAGISEGGFISQAKNHFCNSGPASTASLIVILRDYDLGAATTGDYAGQLTIMIAPL